MPPILAHGGGGALVVLAYLAVILLAEMAAAIVVLAVGDLVAGTAVLLLFRKKRHLFWTLPLLNVALWYLAGAKSLWLPGEESSTAELQRALLLAADWMMYPAAFVVGLLAAGMLAPVQLALTRASGRGDGAAGTLSGPMVSERAADSRDSRPIARPAATGRWPAFREGFLAPWDGLAFMCRHRELWTYGVVPVVLNVLITGCVLLALVVAVGFAVDRLHPLFPAGGGWLALEILSGVALFAAALLGAIISWILLQGVLCGYFYGKLAEKVELKLGLPPEEIREVSLWHQTADATRDVALLAGIHVGLLALHVVPVVGSLAATGGSLYFSFLILGGDFVAYPLDLRGLRRTEKRAYVRRYRYHTLGLGAAVMLLLLVPVVGAVLLTTAVAGSVLLHRRQNVISPTQGGVDAA